MRQKIEGVIFIAMLIVTSVLGLFVFLGVPERFFTIPAYALALLVAAKILIEITIFSFRLKRDPDKKCRLTDEFLRLEEDVKDYNPHVLTVLLVWLGMILSRRFNFQIPEGLFTFLEKIVGGVLIVVAAFVFFALIDYLISRKGKLPLIKPLNKNHEGNLKP